MATFFFSLSKSNDILMVFYHTIKLFHYSVYATVFRIKPRYFLKCRSRNRENIIVYFELLEKILPVLRLINPSGLVLAAKGSEGVAI